MSLPAGELEVAVAAPPVEPVGEPGEVPSRAIQGRSLWQIAMRRLRSDKVALCGGLFALLMILVAVFAAPLTSLYGQKPGTPNPDYLQLDTPVPNGKFGGMSPQFWLGITPVNGNDILAQLIYGIRTSLIIAGAATVFTLLFGVTLGLIAGYFRGWADAVISWFMDLLLSFPQLLFSLGLLAVLSIVPYVPLAPGWHLSGTPLQFSAIIFVLGFFGWPYIGRIVRGQVLSLREKEYVDAARSLGASNFRIITREILPNVMGPILVYTTLTIPNFILGEAGLSFLGVGIQPPTPSLGKLLSDAGAYLENDPTYLFCPGITLFLLVLAFNLFGDGLRDAFDPRSTR
jgi:peptide/nickel transport system permease protein